MFLHHWCALTRFLLYLEFTNSGFIVIIIFDCFAFREKRGLSSSSLLLQSLRRNILMWFCSLKRNVFIYRNTFDEDRVPDLNDEAFLQDIHCVASLLKMYFRELPNPLLTYQLYDKFVVRFFFVSFKGGGFFTINEKGFYI